MKTVLVVEDDHDTADAFAELVQAEGFAASIANTLTEARDQLLIHKPDVVLLDLHLPDGSGLDLFKDASIRGAAEIILMTGNASLETSVQALRLGAADYLIKPVNPDLLIRAVHRALDDDSDGQAPAQNLSRPQGSRTGRIKSDRRGNLIAGSSPAIAQILDQIERVARTSVSVLVVGESGTGKELVAHQVHQQSRRRNGPFKALNCGAISAQLIESELFGHEKGAFTGAIRQHKGIFEQADGGTLFLDEVTEMPMDLQVRLLRVLETGTFNRVGSTDLQHADVRIVAATNRDPVSAVERSLLREDLYYRLNVFQIALPPLRDRLDDLPEIVDAILSRSMLLEDQILKVSERALEQLKQYHWPGNVRELRNMLQRGAVMADNGIIDDIPLLEPHQYRIPNRPVEGAPVILPIGTSIADAERQLILATLKACGGARDKAAAMLAISPKTLYNRLRSYGNSE